MEYDAALEHLGRCGRFQKITAIAMSLVGIPAGFNMVAMTFLGAMADHRCRLHDSSRAGGYAANVTEGLNASIPWENVGGTWRLSQCNMYMDPLGADAGENATIAPCEYGWVYDHSQYSSSIVTEFDLVCDKAWLTELAQSIYMSGVCVGAVLFGALSDRYGRRPILLLCLTVQIPLMFAVAFATDYVTFVTLRFIIGATMNGFLYSGIVIGTEVVHTSMRTLFGMSVPFTMVISYIMLGALAYCFRDWRTLQLAMSIPLVFFLSYWWLAPESPRWLLTNRKSEEAKAVIRKAAKQNGVEIPEKIYELIDQAGEQGPHDCGPRTYTMLDLMRTPKLRSTTILISINWFVLSAVYYGLCVGTASLAGDHYVNFITSACVELVGVFLAWFLMERCGRKLPSVVFMLLGGCACAATAAVPQTYPMISTVLAMVGRFGISVSFNVFYVYSAEVFPTVVRNMGLGVATMLARVGGIIAPFIYLLADTWRPLPLLTFGLMSIVSGLTMLTMPETLGKPLPNTIASVENVSQLPPPILVPDGVVLPSDTDKPLIVFQKLTVL
ncbi:organic cation transporter protein-like [Branchiostoma lanceolatum]|uniref:organic cation transporter protein-like n=1 Tax=Branchiostoma lanceolatum TaxID=7740 RepID=UPI003451B94E